MQTDLKSSALTALFAAWKPRDGESLEGLAAVYHMAIEDVPGWSVQRALKAFIKRKVPGHNPTFRPAPPELAQECERQLWFEIDRQNAHIVAEQRALKADGRTDFFKHRADEMVMPDTVDPDAVPALPDPQFKRLIEHRIDPSMQMAIAKLTTFKPTTEEAV
jgi:hypothetical protein